MQTEKTFDTGELTLNYFEGGAMDAPPLVLLHGLTAQWRGWYPMFPELTSRWHVYAPDMRGHGKSGRAPDNRYRNVDYARDAIAFLQHIGEPVVLMGHSLGAMVSIVTASEFPAGVSAVVLLDPPLFTARGSVRLHADSTHWFELVASIMKDSPSYETVVTRLGTIMPAETAAQTASFIAGVAAGTVETALRDELWQGVDVPRALQSIECPVILIHGDWENGAAMRDEDIAFFKANCPSAIVVGIPNATHNIPQEHPDIVFQQMKEFLPSA